MRNDNQTGLPDELLMGCGSRFFGPTGVFSCSVQIFFTKEESRIWGEKCNEIIMAVKGWCIIMHHHYNSS